MNVSDACSLAVAGETDKFCEVAEENDLSDDVADPKFPVVLCHSPGMRWSLPNTLRYTLCSNTVLPMRHYSGRNYSVHPLS